MKSLILCLSLLVGLSVSYTYAADSTGATTVPLPTVTQTGTLENPLLVDNVDVIDDAHLDIDFNQDIVLESVRVRITKQSDGSNVKIESLTGSSIGKDRVSVNLSDFLEPSTAYKLTIVSAISEANVVIRDGADALREFSTPALLNKSTLTLSAPPNPNAVIVVATGETQSTNTGTPVTTEELPLTGMNPFFFLIIALLGALGIISMRKQAR